MPLKQRRSVACAKRRGSRAHAQHECISKMRKSTTYLCTAYITQYVTLSGKTAQLDDSMPRRIISHKKKKSKMSTLSFKKNWLINFSAVSAMEIVYILNRIGNEKGEVQPGNGLVGAVVSMYFRQPEPKKPVKKHIKVSCGTP